MTTQPVVPPAFRVIDLNTCEQIVTDQLEIVKDLNGVAHGVTRREVADVNRQLLQLADDLMLASTLVRNAYWASRGEESYEL